MTILNILCGLLWLGVAILYYPWGVESDKYGPRQGIHWF
jgi:hypothetical protein